MLPNLCYKRLFITGTNTEVGKTFYACHLLRELHAAGYRTTAIKPVATEAMQTAEGERNQDALHLRKVCLINTLTLSYLPQPLRRILLRKKQGFG